MFKRSTKLTALLVAAASVMSTVPAMASTRLATKEGTIEKAVAFKDGKYIYQGYRTDDDDNGLYYNSGSKDKMLDDVEELGSKFDDKYVSASEDDEDDYVVDLTTGKMTDEDNLSDLKSTAAIRLENKLDDTDRYGRDIDIEEDNLERIEQNNFGEVWYEYTATTTGETTSAEVKGYTNASGKYIDCSYEGNIYAYRNDKVVKLEDIETKEDVRDEEDALQLLKINHVKTLGQDSKYIYRVVSADIKGAQKMEDGSAVDASKEKLYYVQRVSKAQGDKEEDAYLPKNVESFLLASSDNIKDSDINDANTEIMNYVDGSYENAKIAIVDGSIYVIYLEDEEVHISKINLKTSEKIDKNDVHGRIGVHVAKLDDDLKEDAKDFSVDVDGNVWIIHKGEISKSSKVGDFKTVYTCDRSLDKLDVYNEKNLIAWEEDGEVYTTVTEGSEEAKKEAEEIIGEDEKKDTDKVEYKTGWNQAADGNWTLRDVNGNLMTGWSNVGGTWFYMDRTTGAMKTGWLNDNGTWYYLNPVSDGTRGSMKTGWVYDGGTWFYMQANGSMKTGWLYEGGAWYFMNPVSDGTRGTMKTGWQYVGGNWYFFNSNGTMASNTTVGGYRLGASGALI